MVAMERLTFLVRYWGVAMSFIGASAHGLVGAVDDIMKGARVTKRPRRTTGNKRSWNPAIVFSGDDDK